MDEHTWESTLGNVCMSGGGEVSNFTNVMVKYENSSGNLCKSEEVRVCCGTISSSLLFWNRSSFDLQKSKES